jgi:hypothetical protein
MTGKEPWQLSYNPRLPPLHQDTSGALRVGSSRVLVELVIEEREQRAQDMCHRIERHQVDPADLRRRILARQQSG